MSSAWMPASAALIAAFGLVFAIGKLLTLRGGRLEATTETPDIDVNELGLSRTGPTIVRFSAVWCGPCEAARRVVDQVCADLPAVAHVVIDLDANPAAARTLAVLSLPTTFVFDAEGRQRYRSSGVPTGADLRSALEPLLA